MVGIVRKRTKILKFSAVIVVAIALAVFIAETITEHNARYVPNYELLNLREYPGIEEGRFSEDDYMMLLKQTGLGKAAIKSVFAKPDPVSLLEAHQESFFNPPPFTCKKISPVTSEEHFYNDDGSWVKGFVIEDVRNGDIFITKGNHTLGWRQGHTAIVTDAQKGETIEALKPGVPTMHQKVSKWQTYPTLIHLRLKDEKAGEDVAAFVRENLLDFKYGLHAGLFSKYSEDITVTQCSHLPWYAYMRFGYDIDSDGGWLVTPKDIAGSELLEIVQIYGVDPDHVWK